MSRRVRLIAFAVACLVAGGTVHFYFPYVPEWTFAITQSQKFHIGSSYDEVVAAMGPTHYIRNRSGEMAYCYGGIPHRKEELSRLANRYLGLSIVPKPDWWPVEVRYDRALRVVWIRRGRSIESRE